MPNGHELRCGGKEGWDVLAVVCEVSRQSEKMQPDKVTTVIRLHETFSVVLERGVLEQLLCITAPSLIKCVL